MSVNQFHAVVKGARRWVRAGRPSVHTPHRVQAINLALMRAALSGQELPSDSELAQRHQISERSVRTIRLEILGLNRHQLRHWTPRPAAPPEAARQLVCSTPFAGLWLLVPQLLQSGLVCAAASLRVAQRTQVQAGQVILTLVACTSLGFERLFHVDHCRHRADVGLALFTGRWRLWSDSSLWRFVHALSGSSVQAFCQASLRTTLARPQQAGRISLDEHVVPSFTQRKPPPLSKNRIPTRGRAYPAFRLYVGYDLDLGRFVGLLVRKAQQALSQILPELLAEVRRLRQAAQAPHAEQVRLIFDRGGYKGSLFAQLMQDEKVSFIAMARATSKNVAQWATIPETDFQPYQPKDSELAPLRIALTHTQVGNCPQPIPSVVIRDDTPASKQRWRVLFFKNPPDQPAQAEAIDREYRQRQAQELGFRQFVHHLTGHCLPKAYQMIRIPNAQGQKRTTVATLETPQSQPGLRWVAWVKFLTFNLIRDFGQALGSQPGRWQVATLVRRYLARPGRLYLHGRRLIVQLDPFQGDENLRAYLQQVNQRQWSLPWLSGLVLQIELAEQVQGLAEKPHLLRQIIFANSVPAPP